MSEASTLDGLFTFFASHHAVRADKVLREAGFDVLLIAGPKELSPNCGTALRCEYARHQEAIGVLEAKKVEIDEIIQYVPRTDAWPSPRRSLFRRRTG